MNEPINCSQRHCRIDKYFVLLRECRVGRYRNLGGKVIIKSTKTKRSTRTEYLAPFVIAVLRKHRATQAARHLALGLGNQGPDGFVFDRADGRQFDPNEMSRLFSRLVRKHKLPTVRLHDLRHAFATLSFAAGIPPKAVSESLGHSAIGVTGAIYIHLLSQTKRDALRSLRRTNYDAASQSLIRRLALYGLMRIR